MADPETLPPTPPAESAVGHVYQLLLLTAAAAFANYALSAVSPLQETMRTALGLSDNEVALLQGPALALPLALAGIPLGLVVDRYLRARLLLGFVALAILGSLLTAFAPNYIVLFAARSLVGLAVPAISMAALSMIADIYPPAYRGRAFMVMAIGQVGGMSAAFAVGGEVLAFIGPAGSGWRWTLMWLTSPLVILFCLLLLFMREPPRTGVTIENPSPSAAFAELWRYRAVVMPLLVGSVMVSMVDTAALVWAGPTLSRKFNLSPDHSGAIMAGGLMVSGMCGPILGGFLADFAQRTGGPRRTISVLAALMCVSAPAGLFPIVPGLATASVVMSLFLMTGSAISVTAAPIVTVVIPNELRGLSVAILGAISGPLCLGVAPVAVSALSTSLGGPIMIGKALAINCVAISLLGGMALVLGRRYFVRGGDELPRFAQAHE